MKLTGGLTGRVVFAHESAASKYVLHAQQSPITFGDSNQVADVTLISTPTWPLKISTRNKLNAVHHTRCLHLPMFPTHSSLHTLERDIACGNGFRNDALLEVYVDEEQTLHLEFSSVGAAGSAFAILTSWPLYRGLVVEGGSDPCEGGLEELLEKVGPRPPVFPRKSVKGYEDGAGALSEADDSARSESNQIELL